MLSLLVKTREDKDIVSAQLISVPSARQEDTKKLNIDYLNLEFSVSIVVSLMS